MEFLSFLALYQYFLQIYFFNIFRFLGVNSNMDWKWVLPASAKIWIVYRLLFIELFFSEQILLLKISPKFDYIWGQKWSENTPMMGPTWVLIWYGKLWSNFTTIKATVMTLTLIIYINKIFHFAKFCAVICRPSKSINKKPLIKSRKIGLFLLNFCNFSE